ncbi:MAG: EutN/CcmL family microcompartment protein [Akkermansiaceae bacterium]|nr:EutN/CcmL family microcompartment protein [Akkermansiaceae bacterium]MCF7732274.1 EutN/CcmL family microcompartment protein [Akkermansiaceae bacterium]
MRIAQVIGRVTHSIQDPSFKGGRWLMVNPLDAMDLNTACATPPPLSAQFSLVAYDNLGAGEGDIVGIVEGAEATAPFDFPIPIDAITVAIFDSISHTPHPTP